MLKRSHSHHWCTLQLTCGGVQSAHTAAVAAACAEHGMQAHLLIRGEPPAVPTGFHLLARMYGHVTYVSRTEYADRDAMLRTHAQQLRAHAKDAMQVSFVICDMILWIGGQKAA